VRGAKGLGWLTGGEFSTAAGCSPGGAPLVGEFWGKFEGTAGLLTGASLPPAEPASPEFVLIN